MKLLMAAVSLAAVVWAQTPNLSYLPPPPGRANGGYSRGGPKSRGLADLNGNPFGTPARDPLNPSAKYKPEEGYQRNGRNGLDDEEDEPEKYDINGRGYKPRGYDDSEGYDEDEPRLSKGYGVRNGNGKRKNGYNGNGNGNRANGYRESDY